MGKSQSTMSTDAMKKARKYFEAHEINDVMSIFQNLQADERLLEGKADGSTHAGIDIETFGEYFSYPGVLREQIFKVFDSNKDGLIDREEFMRGLAMCCKGSLIEKLEFCFGMFDLSGDGFIDKLELHKCLASTAFASFALLQAVAVEQGFMKDEDCLQPDQFSKEVDSMVADAFDGSDHNGDNKLSFQEFKRWMIKTPEIVGILYSVFDMRGHVDMEDVSKQFDDSKKEMYYDDSKETRIDELLLAKKLSDAMAAKLLSENSHLQKRIRQLEAENAELKKNQNIKSSLVSPRK